MRVRLHSFRARALLACVPATAMVLMGTAGMASASPTPAHTHASLRAELAHVISSLHTNHAIRAGALRGITLKKVTSTNWSGYADTGTGFSSVTAKWTEPKVTGCSTNGALTAVVFWVGIDGFNSQTVEQGGTGAICGQGTPLTYFTWWEMFPSNAIQAVGGTVKPGDKIAASVARNGSKYTIKVTDSTTSGNSFSTTQTCSGSPACTNSSAEWIGERPSTSAGPVPMPKFSTWKVTAATVAAGTKKGTIKTFADNEVTMVNNSNKVLALPSSLNTAGNAFSDVWKAKA